MCGRFERYKRNTPAWADRAKIVAIYSFAKRWGLHVDHDVPVNGDFVCGLHVHNNLRLLPPQQNIKKSNQWPPQSDMNFTYAVQLTLGV